MKMIEVVVTQQDVPRIQKIIAEKDIDQYWASTCTLNDLCSLRFLVPDDRRQAVLDDLQSAITFSGRSRIIVLDVAATLSSQKKEKQQENDIPPRMTREELFNKVIRGAVADSNFFLLVFLSTVVAAIGLIEDSLAVVIGAMVIAPLLGPILAMALTSTLGELRLLRQATVTTLLGLLMAIGVSYLIGLTWPLQEISGELLSRSEAELNSIALALASGVAAVLSLTTGLPTVLVGVMVAVALLPPAATLGILLGNGEYGLATNAGLLLMVNVVCVNLAAKLVFMVKGFKPRTWLERKKTRQSSWLDVMFWIVSLSLLLLVILLR